MANNYKDLPASKVNIELLIKDLQEALQEGKTELLIDGTMWIDEKLSHSVIATNQPQM